MKKEMAIKGIGVVFVIIYVLMLISGCFLSPSIEELSPYIGKTEEDLRSRFGSPDRFTWMPVASPDGLTETENEEWWEKTTIYILRYGNINVEENHNHKILRVYTN